MNRNVYVLLTAAVLVSVLQVAQAETMAERKQRITRKYVRERQSIVQSDLGIPDAPQEDIRIAESEQFKEPSMEFKRQEGGTALPPPVRPLPVQPERNWWLEAQEEGNPFADPFSAKTDTREEKRSLWSPWDDRENSSAYGSASGPQRQEREDIYSSSREGSSIYGGASIQPWDGRDNTYPGSQSVYGMPNESGFGSSASGMTYDDYTSRRSPTFRESDRRSGLYGRPQDDARGMGLEWGPHSGGRYGVSPSSGLQQFPSPSSSYSQDWSSQNLTPEYTPYRNPYEIQDAQQRRSGGNLQPQQPQYSRPNSYQKWKDNNKAWNPDADNSYLDELMRNQRR